MVAFGRAFSPSFSRRYRRSRVPVRPNLPANASRLWDTLMASAAIGRGPRGGIRRLTLTDEDRQMRDELKAWAEAGGYPLTIDVLGNMFLRREGTDASLPPVF